MFRTPSSPNDNKDRLCYLIRQGEEYANDKQILVCGDFNFDNIVWESNTVVAGSHGHGQAQHFLEAINDNFWTQNVEEWTHLRETENPSRLDLIFTKTDCEIDELEYLPTMGHSKHAVLTFTIKTDTVPEERDNEGNKLNYHKADKEKLQDKSSRLDWTNLLRDKSSDDMWTIFKDTYNEIVKECVPLCRKKKKSYASKWMNRRLRTMIARKKEAWKKYRARRSAGRREQYNDIRNEVTREVRTAKYEYERRVALDSKTTAKYFWAYVRSKTTVKDSISKLKTTTGEIAENDKEIAQEMNKAFNGVYVKEDTIIPVPVPDATFQGPKLEDLVIRREDVKNRLQELNDSKAPGPDGISSVILKAYADPLCDPLFNIFRKSTQTGVVPSDWRCANISLIFKKGSRIDPLNYRNNRSCLTNMLCYLDDLVNGADDGHCIDINYLDCEKAFDRVPHHRLRTKLRQWKTTEERDLGILVSCDLKPSQHVAKVAAKANSRLAIIKRNFIRDREILVPLYLSLVRPVMDYGVQSWSPYLVKDIQALEKVQRHATKMVLELSHLPYEERCQRLGLQTLSDRRKRGDMIQTYKLLHGFDDVHTLYQILQAEHKQSQGTLTEAGKTQSLENETVRQLV
ncbi:hypothetical protein Pcinc_001182 [Petrolisthes cinctipes]|uniref:Endonuclease/exonuclease/phosphatase domain-containing protein n=1 Tax=Petrolisthes cinctipes TaxID=88211 RepID=A0AAE1L4S9_PETCI|nr:hypothetical protein Pcinc_001182 [Petrolisthes cinctipes]